MNGGGFGSFPSKAWHEVGKIFGKRVARDVTRYSSADGFDDIQEGLNPISMTDVMLKEGAAKEPSFGFGTSDHWMRFPTYDDTVHHAAISSGDYVRYSTIGLAIRRILTENIDGSFAEVGVYKGHTSRFIHDLAPQRMLFLFDTFEGFPTADLDPMNQADGRFQDTSVEGVQQTIGNLENIVIKKGYFPDTAAGLDGERFSFVLLDLDLYGPTLAGLRFFYPRIVPGGYLFIHDFNSPESNFACFRAVNEFMADKKEKIVEIGDMWGTVLFRKT